MSKRGEQEQGGGQRLHISKYPNRRYYDSTRSRHLTLEEIYSAVRDGYEIEVIDSKTGRDITAKVLAQMIIELDPPKLDIFPVPLLHRLLRANEQLVTDFTQKYFNQALEAFLDSQRKFEDTLRQTLGLKSATPTVADWAKVIWGPFSPATWGGDEDASKSKPAESQGESVAEVERLRQEVEHLKKQLRRKRNPAGKKKQN